MSILSNEDLIKFFRLVCVDNNIDYFISHIGLQKVPTMIVQNMPKPLVSAEIFEWVKQVKFIKYNKILNTNKNPQADEMQGFSLDEMGRLSDNFTYQNPELQIALPQTFFRYGDEKNNVIFTAPEHKKISKNEQEDKIRDLASSRDTEMATIKDVAKQQQIQAVYNNQKQKILQGNFK